jgi:pimeloyl-ACP methyl ester carboxylesterase
LEETIFYLRERGVERIYLAGLSNGGIGASRLANQYQSDLAGLILISGADPTSVPVALPILVIHGETDERIPVSMIEDFVLVSGSKATYHLFEGDHFVLLKQADQVQNAVANWLMEQEANFQ